MKILLIDVYHYHKGGAETVCLNTGKILEEHGHDVIYFALQWDKNLSCKQDRFFPLSKETRKGFFRNVLNLIHYFYYADAARKIEQLILDEKPDIAHIHLLWGQISPSILPVLKKYQIPIVFTMHDFRLVCPAYSFKDGYNRICEACAGEKFYKCVTHKCTKRSYFLSFFMAGEQYFRNYFFYPIKYINGFIYVSNFAKEKLEKYMPQMKNVPNITLYNFSTEILSNSFYPSKKYFLYFGRLSYEKGVETLMRAFAQLPEYTLKIAGTGPLENDLNEFKQKHKLNNVEFVGYKRGEELVNLVRDAYFVIVPSEWYENNPMSIVESYSTGTPVIGARIGGIPEIIIDEKTGYQFESANINSLMDIIRKADGLSVEEYKAFCQEAISFAKMNFIHSNYYSQLLSFYNTFLK